MRFSNEYDKIQETDCFDPILIADTELFVDPFAVFEETEGFFSNSFEKMLRFFNQAFILAANANRDSKTISYKKLESMLMFPEINELGLGYSNTNAGAGASRHFCKQMICAIYRSIDQGLMEYKHFEEIGIFEEGIGCDRISDITCNILKEELISYTQEICKRYSIPMVSIKMPHIRFDFENLRWVDGNVMLPWNRHKKRAVLLVPQRFLNDLPSINYEGFGDYIWNNMNETLRNDLNYSLKQQLDKAAIIEIARQNPQWVRLYEEQVERQGYESYDIKNDPTGKYIWASNVVQEYIKDNPLSFTDSEGFARCIQDICLSFKSYIENEKGYELLWNEGDKPKPESAVQRLLFGVMKGYCLFLNIDISKESNAGSGPVDFKCSQGYSKRVLIETKLIRNTRYWNGLEKQLPQYMLAEGIEKGIFMLITYTAEEFNKASEFKRKIKQLNLPYDIETMIVDASYGKLSASKL